MKYSYFYDRILKRENKEHIEILLYMLKGYIDVFKKPGECQKIYWTIFILNSPSFPNSWIDRPYTV